MGVSQDGGKPTKKYKSFQVREPNTEEDRAQAREKACAWAGGDDQEEQAEGGQEDPEDEVEGEEDSAPVAPEAPSSPQPQPQQPQPQQQQAPSASSSPQPQQSSFNSVLLMLQNRGIKS